MKSLLLSALCSLAFTASLTAKTALEITAEPEQRLYHIDTSQEVVIKIDLTGATSSTKRTPLNIAVVLDRSGSMSGAKIEKAKQAACQVVDQLGAHDIFSMVVFDTDVQVLIPAQPVEDKEMLKARIARIQPGGSTALYGGVERGSEQLSRYFSDRKINRVLLLSDGLANVGPSSTSEITSLGHRLAGRSMGVSTIGVGDDYNEDIMSALALASDANYYYVRDVEELPGIFAKELGQLLSIVARNVRVRITCPEEIEPIGFIGRPEIFEDHRATVEFSPFASGQNRYLFLRCRVHGDSSMKALQIARVEASYTDELHGGEIQSVSQNVKVGFTANVDDAIHSQNKDVFYQKELMLNALAKDEAIRKADAGNYAEARQDLEKQASRMRSLAPCAPMPMQGQFKSEADNVAAKSSDVKEDGVSSGWRKSMQSEAYKTKNAKD